MPRVDAGGLWPDSSVQAGNTVIMGLSDQEVFSVARFAAGISGRFMVEYHEDQEGTASALLFHECREDVALIFQRDGIFLHLDAINNDTLECVASAQRIEWLFSAAQTYVYARGWAA
jgi:ABC-type polar amino acid transport system ATPase subunit